MDSAQPEYESTLPAGDAEAPAGPDKEQGSGTIIVPVARPDTAGRMLRLAHAILGPGGGRVVALTISLGNAEEASKQEEALRPVLAALADEGLAIEYRTEIATSVSRGILEVARETTADLIILGVQQPEQGQVALGSIVENVTQTAPCDVLVYRLNQSAEPVRRVVVPVDNRDDPRVALEFGIRYAQQNGLPLHLIIRRGGRQGLSQTERVIEAMLADAPDVEVTRRMVAGHGAVSRMLREISDADLVVLGFRQRDDLDLQLTAQTVYELFNEADGSVVLISRLFKARFPMQSRLEQLWVRLRPEMTMVERSELAWQSRHLAEPTLDYVMMIIFSAGLATLGLLANSTAVIIGAMLVAPLMSPLSAMSIGLSTGRTALARRASLTLLIGIATALGISLTIGVLFTIPSPTDEMLARGNPSVLDAMVALVSGLVAGYGAGRKGVSAALAGVAIAAALMPPVCTIGLGLAMQDFSLASGAALLFITNIIFIVVAQYVIFVWMGMRRAGDELPAGDSNGVRFWWLVITAAGVFVLITLVGLGAQDRMTRQMRAYLEASFSQSTVIDFAVTAFRPIEVDATIRTAALITTGQIEALEREFVEVFGAQTHIRLSPIQVVTSLWEVDTVRQELVNRLPGTVVRNIAIISEDPLEVMVTMISDRPISQGQIDWLRVHAARDLGVPLGLVVEVVPIIRSSAGGVTGLDLPDQAGYVVPDPWSRDPAPDAPGG
jgi:uncharacterized hydrophobic protein (TIGR00271 family)